MSVADMIYELAVADDVYIRNGSGSIIGMETFNVQRFTIQYKYTIMHCHCKLSNGEGWDAINWLNPTTIVCLSQAWILNVICHGLFNVKQVEVRGLFC